MCRPMNVQDSLSIRRASQDERFLVETMIERYLTDLGGSGPYPHLERYWQEPGRSPYLICYEASAVGFALVERLDQETNELVEFYVQASHRGQGIGRRAVSSLFSAHTGSWRVGVRKDNALGQDFWKAFFDGHASVSITEVAVPPALIYKVVGGREA